MGVRHILSIDGGGVRGIIAAVLLDVLDGERRALGATRPLGDCFDLIAGTSTGAIIAAGLAAPSPEGDWPLKTPADLRDLYRTRAPQIFPMRFLCRMPVLGRLRQFFGPLYKPETLERILTEELGEGDFLSLRRNLFISAYSINPREAAYFRGGPAYADTEIDDDFAHIKLVDALMGSTAAPTFFPPRQVENRRTGAAWTVIDGAVFLNDPALAAFAEATALFPGDEIQIVSIGSGRLVNPYPYAQSRGWGFLEWLSPVGPYRTPLLSAIADGQARAVHGELTQLLGARYRRFDYDLEAGYGSPHIDDGSRRNLRRLEQGALKMAELMRPRLRELASALG